MKKYLKFRFRQSYWWRFLLDTMEADVWTVKLKFLNVIIPATTQPFNECSESKISVPFSEKPYGCHLAVIYTAVIFLTKEPFLTWNMLQKCICAFDAPFQIMKYVKLTSVQRCICWQNRLGNWVKRQSVRRAWTTHQRREATGYGRETGWKVISFWFLNLKNNWWLLSLLQMASPQLFIDGF